jgi:phosphatidylinositol alpha-1,6-mannosyltransferase
MNTKKRSKIELMQTKSLSLKIFLILTEWPPSIGGMQAHAIYLSTFLNEQNYDIEVVTYQPVTKEEIVAFTNEDTRYSFPVHRILSRIGYMHNIKLLERLIRKNKANLIYSSTVFYGILEKRLNIPVICRSPGNDVLRPWIVYPFAIFSSTLSYWRFEKMIMKFFKRRPFPKITERIFRNKRFDLMKSSAKSSSLIFANSEFTYKLLRKIGVDEEHIEILVGGVDYNHFDKRTSEHQRSHIRKICNIPVNSFLLMSSCRLVEKKGIDFLIRVISTYNSSQDEVNKWYLCIVGDGRRRKSLKKLSKKLKVTKYVHFVGSVPFFKIQPFYATADVFVLASRISTNKRSNTCDAETMGRVLCEANAAGIPVVAANSGGIPSVITHEYNGLLFTPDNMQEFIVSVNRIKEDSNLREYLIASGKQIAKNTFNWSIIMKKHQESFQTIIRQ